MKSSPVLVLLMILLIMTVLSTSAVGRTSGELFFPEPFDFHYPEEGRYADVASSVRLEVSPGERHSGTFVYVPRSDGPVEVFANDLVGPGGSTLPKDLIDVGVVTFMNRDRNPEYLQNIWLRGQINQDAKAHAPIMPMAIVPDEKDFFASTPEGVGPIRLQDIDHARAIGRAGMGSQFWVTVDIPPAFQPPQLRSTYVGNLTLVVDGSEMEVPIEVEVLNVQLDDPWSQGKHIGVFQAVDQFDAEFRDVVTRDLTAHGANAVYHRDATPADYAYFAENGIDFVLNADNVDVPAAEIQEIGDMGYLPLFYGYDEPNHTGRYADHIDVSRNLHGRGGLIGTSGSLAALQEIDAAEPQDWWNISLATSWAPTNEVFAHLDAVRADPSGAKIAARESVYPMTLLELYPLNTRLLYGFWLFNSNLDGGFAWAYANDVQKVNPFTTPDWEGVAFPAEFYENGVLTHREMLPSYVWEAFGSAAHDFRYAMTAKRLVAESGTANQQDRYRELMASYQRIFSEVGDIRIDVVNAHGTVRETRSELIDLIAELVPPRE